jgi:hypothetical protein
MFLTRTRGACPHSCPISRLVQENSPWFAQTPTFADRCWKTLTVEALGWSEFGLCLLTMMATCFWIGKTNKSFVSDWHRLLYPFRLNGLALELFRGLEVRRIIWRCGGRSSSLRRRPLSQNLTRSDVCRTGLYLLCMCGLFIQNESV